MDFFISHAGRDRAWAEWVAWQLVAAGYEVELDIWDWTAGDNFVTKMATAMENSDRVIALFSAAYFDPQRYTTDEWSAAMVKDDQGRARLLPLRIEECDVPQLLRPLITHTLFGLTEQQAGSLLLQAARGPQRPDGKPAFPPSEHVAPTQPGMRPRLPGTQPPVWNVPPRNAAFTGRDGALASLRERLLSGGAAAVQALHGMGGVGKTQLAIEYAHRFAGDYDLVWWIAAEQPDLVGEQFAALAVAADLVGTSVDHTAALLAIRKRLREHQRWLLIFDNAEDFDALQPWWPEGSGHVLVTSRNPRWDEVAVRVQVDLFARPESVALLRSRLVKLDDADADLLADALGDLPLALAQARGTLAETGMSTTEYLDLLAHRTGDLLDENPPASYPVSLAAAVQLSLDRLAGEDPAAVQLLELCAMLAPAPIPTAWLSNAGAHFDHPLAGVVADRLKLGKVIGRIERYGLARVEAGIQLHRIIIAIIRDRLPAERQQTLHSCAETVLASAHPGDCEDTATWPVWAQLLPHVIQVDASVTDNASFRGLACDAALYLLRRGDTSSALPFVQHLHKEWCSRIGPDDISTLWAATELAHSLFNLGDFAGARAFVEDTLPRWQREFGADNPGTLRSVSDYAVILYLTGEGEKAVELAQDVLDRRTRLLGVDHPDTLLATYHLAYKLRSRPDYVLARQLLLDVIARQRRILGEDHPHTLRTTKAFADLLCDTGDFEKARPLYVDVIARQRRVLGEGHSQTIESTVGLTGILVELDEFEEARPMLADAMARQRLLLGEDHIECLRSLAIFNMLVYEMGEHERGQRLAADLWARRSRALGEYHPDTMASLSNFGAMLLGVNRAVQARAHLAKARASQREILGANHGDTLLTSANLAVALYRVGKGARAREVALDTIARCKLVFGEESQRTLTAASRLRPLLRFSGGKSKRGR